MRRRCRQLLHRLSGRERRFQTWLNHTISYRIVHQALSQGCVLALEDLTGIRQRTNEQPRSRTERRRANSWAFYQLRQFLTYKAARFGVSLVLVNAAYTSQTCHRCLHLGKRSDKSFACGECGYHGDADFNAAKNIALLGAVVNQPDGPGIFCSLSSSPRALESSLQTA
jgi:IS605 OrfB family transposase